MWNVIFSAYTKTIICLRSREDKANGRLSADDILKILFFNKKFRILTQILL